MQRPMTLSRPRASLPDVWLTCKIRPARSTTTSRSDVHAKRESHRSSIMAETQLRRVRRGLAGIRWSCVRPTTPAARRSAAREQLSFVGNCVDISLSMQVVPSACPENLTLTSRKTLLPPAMRLWASTPKSIAWVEWEERTTRNNAHKDHACLTIPMRGPRPRLAPPPISAQAKTRRPTLAAYAHPFSP